MFEVLRRKPESVLQRQRMQARKRIHAVPDQSRSRASKKAWRFKRQSMIKGVESRKLLHSMLFPKGILNSSIENFNPTSLEQYMEIISPIVDSLGWNRIEEEGNHVTLLNKPQNGKLCINFKETSEVSCDLFDKQGQLIDAALVNPEEAVVTTVRFLERHFDFDKGQPFGDPFSSDATGQEQQRSRRRLRMYSKGRKP